MSPAPDLITDDARELLRMIDSGEVLGATRQLALLGECLLALARSGADDSTLRTAAASLVSHIALSRGESSQAVINGVRLMAAPALATSETGRALAADIEAAVAAFLRSLQTWLTDVRRNADSCSRRTTRFSPTTTRAPSHTRSPICEAAVAP